MALYLLLGLQMRSRPPILLLLCCLLRQGFAARAWVRALSSVAPPQAPLHLVDVSALPAVRLPSVAPAEPSQLEHAEFRSVPGLVCAPVALPEAAFAPLPAPLPAVGVAEPPPRHVPPAGVRWMPLCSLDPPCPRPGLSGLFLEPHPPSRAVLGSAEPVHLLAFLFRVPLALPRELSPLLSPADSAHVSAGSQPRALARVVPVLPIRLPAAHDVFLEALRREALFAASAPSSVPLPAESDPRLWRVA